MERDDKNESRGLDGLDLSLVLSHCETSVKRFAAMSTPEAENKAMFEACSDAIWLPTSLAELKATIKDFSALYCVSTVSINRAERLNSMSQAKYIDMKYQFITQVTAEEIIGTVILDLDKNLPDDFTKPLNRTRFELFFDLIR